MRVHLNDPRFKPQNVMILFYKLIQILRRVQENRTAVLRIAIAGTADVEKRELHTAANVTVYRATEFEEGIRRSGRG